MAENTSKQHCICSSERAMQTKPLILTFDDEVCPKTHLSVARCPPKTYFHFQRRAKATFVHVCMFTIHDFTNVALLKSTTCVFGKRRNDYMVHCLRVSLFVVLFLFALFFTAPSWCLATSSHLQQKHVTCRVSVCVCVCAWDKIVLVFSESKK